MAIAAREARRLEQGFKRVALSGAARAGVEGGKGKAALGRQVAAPAPPRDATGPRCFWMPDDEDRAITLRQHIFVARLGRAELLTSDAHRKHIVFHDLRATGTTWMAVRGDDPLRIKQRAGHRSFSTTEGYIREAETLREGFGTPFPPLPAELLGNSATNRNSATAELNKPAQNDTLKWSKGGSNP